MRESVALSRIFLSAVCKSAFASNREKVMYRLRRAPVQRESSQDLPSLDTVALSVNCRSQIVIVNWWKKYVRDRMSTRINPGPTKVRATANLEFKLVPMSVLHRQSRNRRYPR
jgi:hypothetical protein